MGFCLAGLTLEGQDLHRLLQMKDGEIRERLSVWYTRFGPWKSSEDRTEGDPS